MKARGFVIENSCLHNDITEQMQQWKSSGLLRNQRVVSPLENARCRVDGRIVHDFSSNDYLGFSKHPEVVQAATEAIQQYGVGSKASMLVSGWTPAHENLKNALREFEQSESALLFSSGYAACQGVISAVVQPEGIVFCDRLNHSCLIAGAKLSGAKLKVYRHHRLDVLKRELAKNESAPRRWIITETVFGMDGEVAPLSELLELAEEYDAYLICDEAHATGIYGSSGRGVVGQLLEESTYPAEMINRRIPIKIGTLSKALGSQGGFVTGTEIMMQFLWNQSATAMFSTALAVPACAAATRSIELLRDSNNASEKVKENARFVRAELTSSGFELLGDSVCPIIPVLIGEPDQTMALAANLEQEGFLVGAIRPPTVPNNSSRLRISIQAGHELDVLKQLIKLLKKHRP